MTNINIQNSQGIHINVNPHQPSVNEGGEGKEPEGGSSSSVVDTGGGTHEAEPSASGTESSVEEPPTPHVSNIDE